MKNLWSGVGLMGVFLLMQSLIGCGGGHGGAQVRQGQEGDYQPRTRHYYIAAEDVTWDFAPKKKNFIKPGMGLGDWGVQTQYGKTRYVEYIDDSFEEKSKKTQEPHLGLLGPVIRGVVGDTIKVHFHNKASLPYSIHPHGVFYTKDNEGAGYAGKSGLGSAIPPGGSYTYTFEATEESGPGPSDGSSVFWLYHSHVDSVHDIYRGLMGPMVITRADMAREDGTPIDVDRELFNLFMVFNENGEGEDEEGHLMHAINGFVFGNQPGLTMKVGERVRWYLLGMGTEVDLHTPHWHGATVLHEGRRKDVVELLPTTMTYADMVAKNQGQWLFHCHVTDHITAGMISLYDIL